jgi:hypothetical protein
MHMSWNQENVDFLQGLGKRTITLNDYLKAYYGVEILPYNNTLDEILKKVINRVYEITNEAYNNPSHKYYYAPHKRINEYGNHVEDVLCQAIEDVDGSKAKNLGVGYPDLSAKMRGMFLYPECKISRDIEKASSLRSFYTSVPAERTKKIKNLQDGMHLLFKFEHNGPGVLTGRHKVFDLNGMEYVSEALQQGNDKNVYDCEMIFG